MPQNLIQGNVGSDHLIGLRGDDELDGGANNDVYDYRGSFGSGIPEMTAYPTAAARTRSRSTAFRPCWPNTSATT